MNDELRHANYKYIKREWKNGKWQYTYANNNPKNTVKGADNQHEASKYIGTSTKRPEGSRIQKMSDEELMKRRSGLVTAHSTKDGGTIKLRGNLGGKYSTDFDQVKVKGTVREDGPDDQNAANEYQSKQTKVDKAIVKFKNNVRSGANWIKKNIIGEAGKFKVTASSTFAGTGDPRKKKK